MAITHVTKVVMCIVVRLAYSCCSTITSAQFDHFKLVHQWPNSFCNQQYWNQGRSCKRTPVPQHFTLHGLWPDNSASQLNNCHPYRSALRELQRVMNDGNLTWKLDYIWPDLKQPYPQHYPFTGFWRYQWKKHGSCAWPSFNVRRYFDKALQLSNNPRYNVTNILAGIIHPARRNVALNLIHQAIFNATRHIPMLKCYHNYYLLEVIICFDNQGTYPVNCTSRVLPNERCRNSFVFIPNSFPILQCM